MVNWDNCICTQQQFLVRLSVYIHAAHQDCECTLAASPCHLHSCTFLHNKYDKKSIVFSSVRFSLFGFLMLKLFQAVASCLCLYEVFVIIAKVFIFFYYCFDSIKTAFLFVQKNRFQANFHNCMFNSKIKLLQNFNFMHSK